ncbi:MAG: hypothetical protein QP773_11410, partial [Winkia sp. UMB3164B]|nr:hypothetical protein [Winkia sp. UMB3164B]
MTAKLLTWFVHDREAASAVRTGLLAHWLGFLSVPPRFMSACGRAKPSPNTSPNGAGTPLAYLPGHHQPGVEISVGAVRADLVTSQGAKLGNRFIPPARRAQVADTLFIKIIHSGVTPFTPLPTNPRLLNPSMKRRKAPPPPMTGS